MVSIGKINILLHMIMEAAGYFIGFRYFLYLKKKKGDSIEQQNRVWIIIGAIFGAVIGCRLIGCIERPYEWKYIHNTWEYIYSNKTVLGGFLGGLFGVELVKKIIKEKKSSGDLFTYPLVLALIIGRIGCFAMGVYEETYGITTTFFTGMDLGDGLLRHPVMLYEIVFLLLLWVFLFQLEKIYTLAEGGRFKIFMIAYLLFRFMTDFIKPRYFTIAGLTTIQLTSLVGLVYYYSYIIHPKKLLKQNA